MVNKSQNLVNVVCERPLILALRALLAPQGDSNLKKKNLVAFSICYDLV